MFYIFAGQLDFYAITISQFIIFFLILAGIFALALLPSIFIFCENFVATYIEVLIDKAKNQET